MGREHAFLHSIPRSAFRPSHQQLHYPLSWASPRWLIECSPYGLPPKLADRPRLRLWESTAEEKCEDAQDVLDALTEANLIAPHLFSKVEENF